VVIKIHSSAIVQLLTKRKIFCLYRRLYRDCGILSKSYQFLPQIQGAFPDFVASRVNIWQGKFLHSYRNIPEHFSACSSAAIKWLRGHDK